MLYLLGNLYRKNAFNCLHKNTLSFIDGSAFPKSTSVKLLPDDASAKLQDTEDDFISTLKPSESLRVFDESIDFSLEAGVPDPLPFETKLRNMLDQHEGVT
jgi:hypothetical protein